MRSSWPPAPIGSKARRVDFPSISIKATATGSYVAATMDWRPVRRWRIRSRRVIFSAKPIRPDHGMPTTVISSASPPTQELFAASSNPDTFRERLSHVDPVGLPHPKPKQMDEGETDKKHDRDAPGHIPRQEQKLHARSTGVEST
jgi:hypothetical protein